MPSNQLEFSFMESLHKLHDAPLLENSQAYNQEDIIALFDDQFTSIEESAFELKRIESWGYSNNQIEVLIFKDLSLGQYYRAERLANNRTEITNFINSWEVLSLTMIELPEVKYATNDKGVLAWVYK